jgi:outer membrane protein assembly factor BamB
LYTGESTGITIDGKTTAMAKALLRLALVTAVAAAEGAPAAGAGEQVHEVLRARAEAPAEAAAGGGGAFGVGAGHRLFYFTGPDNAPVVRALPDVDGDGRDEVLVGIDESGTDNIFCLDGASSGAATVVWSVETADGVSGGSPYGDQSLVPASDADGNGFADVLAGTAWGGRTAYRLDGSNGAVHWRFDTYLTADSGWVYSLAELADVSGDGVPEVAFGVGSDSDSVYLIDGASGGVGQATVRWRYQAADAILSVRNLGDASGDGKDDVLAAAGDFAQQILALDGGTGSSTGNLLWQYPTGVTAYAVGVLPDLTGDGVAEALAVLWTTNGSAIRALDGAAGTLLWASTEVPEFGVMVDLLEDTNGDGVPEVIVSSFENAVILLDGATGVRLWRTPVGTLNGGDVWSARAIGDLDGDGHEDVVAGSFDYHVYALDGGSGEILWAYDTGNRVFSVHPLGDLNGDGRPEVAAGTQDTNSNVVVHVLDGAGGVVFADGFESGDTGAWSATTPP